MNPNDFEYKNLDITVSDETKQYYRDELKNARSDYRYASRQFIKYINLIYLLYILQIK